MNITALSLLQSTPSHVDVLIFSRHMATLIKAGVPILDALSTLSDGTSSSSLKKIIQQLSKDVQNGQSFTKALRKHPRTFDKFYCSLIEISEKTGMLDENLEFIAQQLAKNYALQKKIQSAMLYPTLIFSAAIVMGGFISFFILPQLVNFFLAFEIELPLSTKILLFIANTFKNFGVEIAVVLLLAVAATFLLLQNRSVRFFRDSIILRIPVYGAFIISTQLAQFTRNLGVLLKSGVPIIEGIEITAHTLANHKFSHDVQEIGKSLEKGKNISQSISTGKYTEIPPLVAKMVAVGEKTGKLDDSLLYLGDFYEEEIDTFSKNLTTILEPALLLTIGLIVGFVALAIITPIYELTGSIRR